MYIGGDTHKITQMHIDDEDELAIAYYREWVTGLPHYNPSETEMSNFKSMFRQSVNLFKPKL